MKTVGKLPRMMNEKFDDVHGKSQESRVRYCLFGY